MESILRALRNPPLSTVSLGYTEDGREVGIDPDALRTHVQFIGRSGKGKSRAVEHLIRELIIQRSAGMLFIDPHGEVYDALVEWCAARGPEFLQRHKVHLFDPADPSWRMAFNPLHVPAEGGEIADRVDLVLDAVSQVMGGEALERMPLYQRVFGAIIYALAARRLTLLETLLVLPSTQDAFRLWLAQNLPDRVMHAVWQEIHAWKPREYTDFVGSTFSRVTRILRNPSIRSVLCQTEHVINFQPVMDDGHIVLVNLKPRPGFAGESPLVLGKLLVNAVFSAALARVPNTSRPFFLIVDEAYQYLNEDIEKTLDQTRKFGLHVVLAYQRLGQLRERGDAIYDGVMQGCQTKVVFGTNYETAKGLADDLFATQYDLEHPKHTLDKPVVTGYKLRTFKQFIEGETHTRGKGGAASISESEGSGEGQNEYYPDPEVEEVGALGKSTNAQRGSAATLSTSWQDTLSKMKSAGVSEALEPILTMMVTQVHSLEEQRHLAAVELKHLGQQQAYVQLPDEKTAYRIKTHDVERPHVRPAVVAAFKQEACATSGFATPLDDIEPQVEARWAQIEQGLQEPVDTPEPSAEPIPIARPSRPLHHQRNHTRVMPRRRS